MLEQAKIAAASDLGNRQLANIPSVPSFQEQSIQAAATQDKKEDGAQIKTEGEEKTDLDKSGGLGPKWSDFLRVHTS